jgi:hypothetical protein
MAAAGCAPAPGNHAVFPFVKGTMWTYEGAVKWTREHAPPRSNSVRWTSRVVAAFDDGDVAGALLDGGVWDLARWSPGKRTESYLLLRVQNRYYSIRHDAKTLFAEVTKSGHKALPPNLDEDTWFDTPLKSGAIYRPKDDAPRGDTMYGWQVAESPSRSAFVLRYDTLPDEETLTLVRGVGITWFAYAHHGTVAEADVRLIAYHRGVPREPARPPGRGCARRTFHACAKLPLPYAVSSWDHGTSTTFAYFGSAT